MNSDHDVVITGIGVVSPIGIGSEAFWQSLSQGVSGVRVRNAFSDCRLPCRIAANVQDFEPKHFVKPRKALKIMCEPIQFACAAAAMAVEQAGLDATSDRTVSPDRIGVIFGTDTFFADPNEVADVFRSCIVNKDYQHDRWGEFAMREIQPLWMLKYLPNMAASHISIAVDARGPSNSICQGEASSMLAVIEAVDLIRRGSADVVVTGGTGCQMDITCLLYRGFENLSKQIDTPEQASRPFDAQRDGMVVGEGSGCLVLENGEHARQRGAKIYGRVGGWSRGYAKPGCPSVQSRLEDIYREAAAMANLDSGVPGFVNANASGSVADDPIEAKAIASVFTDTPVVAHKSNFGNLGPGTSVVELIGSVLALDAEKVPPTINYGSPDERCPVNVNTELVDLKNPSVLKSSISSTGQMVAVVLDK